MIETDRLVAPQAESAGEDAVDRAIRPRSLDEYVGQKAVREQMGIFLQAARGRDEPLDHTLIFGPPGLGKPTLAHIIANELGVQFRATSAPAVTTAQSSGAVTATRNTPLMSGWSKQGKSRWAENGSKLL